MASLRPTTRLLYLMFLIVFALVTVCCTAQTEYFLNARDIPVYVINLETRKDRRANMETSLKTDRVVYIKAVHGAEVEDIVHQKLHNNKLTKGEGGCALSHLKIYQEIVTKDIPYAIIFEDDVNIKLPDDYDKIQQLVDAVPEDWNLLYLATNNGGTDIGSTVYEKPNAPVYGAHGYVIKKELAALVLEYVQKNAMDEPFDFLISNQQHFPSLRAFKAKENIVTLTSGDSDTQGIR